MNSGLIEIDLPSDERDRLKSISRSVWYALRVRHPLEWEGKSRLRTSELAIYADQAVRIRSLEVRLPASQEIFRLQIDSRPFVDGIGNDLVDVSGDRGPLLRRGQILPRPERVSLIWNSYQFDSALNGDGASFEVVVPDSLLIEGTQDRLLVTQHELPNWLLLSTDDSEIEAISSRAVRIERE